eukprot:2258860-Pyramimonas_sp.AAC.1
MSPPVRAGSAAVVAAEPVAAWRDRLDAWGGQRILHLSVGCTDGGSDEVYSRGLKRAKECRSAVT